MPAATLWRRELQAFWVVAGDEVADLRCYSCA